MCDFGANQFKYFQCRLIWNIVAPVKNVTSMEVNTGKKPLTISANFVNIPFIKYGQEWTEMYYKTKFINVKIDIIFTNSM